MGVPRQVLIWLVVGRPRILATCSLICLGVRGENQVFDLMALMSQPDNLQKSNKSRLRFLQSLVVAFVNKKMSLAKKRCERRTPILKFIGWILLSWTTLFSLMDSLSKQRINKYGERGSPCRIPWLGTIFGRGDPFHRI